MDHKLSVLVQIDRHDAYVRLVVTGRMTAANQHVLHPVVARARTLIAPAAVVTVDLTCADHVDPAAVDLLRGAVGHDEIFGGRAPVEILVPDRSLDHRAVVPMTARTRARPVPAAGRRTA